MKDIEMYSAKMVLVYWFTYIPLLMFSTVCAEINQNVPFIILYKNGLSQTTLDLFESNIHDMGKLRNIILNRGRLEPDDEDSDDISEDDETSVETTDLEINHYIRQNNDKHRATPPKLLLPATLLPGNDKNKIYLFRADKSLPEYRKSSWISSCSKKSAKQCRKACKQAMRNLCSIYSCKRRLKRSAKKECKRSCVSKFVRDRDSRTHSDYE